MKDAHVIPARDMTTHEASGLCICGPEPTFRHDSEIRMWIHNALDARERLPGAAAFKDWVLIAPDDTSIPVSMPRSLS